MDRQTPAPNASIDKLRREMESYYWWHSIDLGNGLITRGQVPPERTQRKQEAVFDPVDLDGKTVLDVGAWDGAYSIGAKRLGARRVVALDHFTWIHPTLRGKASFDFALRATGLEIEAVVRDLAVPESLSDLGPFDVVLFLGVFYHLLDPIHVLQQLARITRETLVVETHIETFSDPRPAMVFYPGAELAGDPTNWWGPNIACVEALLRTVGFKETSTSLWASERAVFHARK